MRVHLALAMLPTWLPLWAAIAATPPANAQDAAAGQQDARHWAFAPLPPRPAPTASDGGASEIDAMIAQQLAAAGLAPSPRADRRSLLRRASFALTGLPPTATEVDAFAADPAADSFARAVDRLLASPHYGERQARWWLDLARYSDSNGLDENLAFGDAFRYRDWVVQACNADLPFDRFGTLQIAGDLLADAEGLPAAADRHVATGFLALGPRMLAEQDKQKLELDVVDEQIDLVGRTFLGLTLGCARCHDHKFDPVPTSDYYALAGIFKSTRSFANLDHVSRWLDRELLDDQALAHRKQLLAEQAAAVRARDDAQKQAFAEARAALVQDLGRALLAAHESAHTALWLEAESAARTSLHIDDSHWGDADCTVLHTHRGGPQFAEWELDIRTPGAFRLEVRYAAKESRPMRVLVDGRIAIENALQATTGDWFPAQQRWFTAGELTLAAGHQLLRLEGHGPHVPHLDALRLVPVPATTDATAGADARAVLPDLVRAIATVLQRRSVPELLQPWRELAAVADAGFPAAARALQGRGGPFAVLLGGLPPESRRELAARYQTLFAAAVPLNGPKPDSTKGDGNQTAPAAGLDPTLAAARKLLFGSGGWLAVDDDALRTLLPAPVASRLAELEAAATAAAAAVPPAPPTAMCVADGVPVDLPVHVRGNHLTLASTPTKRGFLSALADVPTEAIPADGSGRLQLAHWLFHPQNPLPARVLANRVWQQLFGHGLVRSPSNFGVRGEQPTHPELLDWLAATLVADGWSLKRLQRRILLSATWQQQSLDREDGRARDPENRLCWRQHRRRLQAEELRDAILATAGTLDRTLGGSLLTTKNRDYVTNDQSNDQARYDAPRRSLYLPIIRNAMYELFTAFDYPDPSVHVEQRPTSSTPMQALFLVNGPFARAQSAMFAKAALGAATDDDARIDWIWRQALLREPSVSERDAARRWLAAAGAQESDTASILPWQGLCQALLASNEFAYID